MEWIKDNWVYITFGSGIIGGLLYYLWKFFTDKKFKKSDFTSDVLSNKAKKAFDNIDHFIEDYRMLKKNVEYILENPSSKFDQEELLNQRSKLESTCSRILSFLAEDDNKNFEINDVNAAEYIHQAKNKLVNILNRLLYLRNTYDDETRTILLMKLREVNVQEKKIRQKLGEIKSGIISSYSKKI